MTENATLPKLPKSPSGIDGLDEVTGGGLPAGRPTLVIGNAGCGKTLLGIQFLVSGAIRHDEPGVLLSFEETREELTANVASLGHNLVTLIDEGMLRIDHFSLPPGTAADSGEYNLEGLFIRLGAAIDSIGAKRVMLDTLEVLFTHLPDPALVRAELHRLFTWLKQKGVTAIITAESGNGANGLSRYGIEEYVSDCVLLLDNRVSEQLSSRRIRVVKYRGSAHGNNEYPFLIDAGGISILPITSLTLKDCGMSTERISSGVDGLDAMLGGEGFFRDSGILVTGTAGTGKSSFGAHLADAAARRGERTLIFAYEESAGQIVRNMRSIGIDLGHWLEQGFVKIHATRPSAYGLEQHLLTMQQQILKFQPRIVIIDPLNSFESGGDTNATKAMLTRMLDYLKSQRITAFCSSLTTGGNPEEWTNIGISSLMDTWLLLRNRQQADSRHHTVSIVKSRGMKHSTRVEEYRFTEQGLVIDAESGADNNAFS